MLTNEDITVLALQGKTFQRNQLYFYCVSGATSKDYPDFSDAFIEEAAWIIDKTELTEDEIAYLNDSCPDTVYELAHDFLF